mgnify:FL=1
MLGVIDSITVFVNGFRKVTILKTIWCSFAENHDVKLEKHACILSKTHDLSCLLTNDGCNYENYRWKLFCFSINGFLMGFTVILPFSKPLMCFRNFCDIMRVTQKFSQSYLDGHFHLYLRFNEILWGPEA